MYIPLRQRVDSLCCLIGKIIHIENLLMTIYNTSRFIGVESSRREKKYYSFGLI